MLFPTSKLRARSAVPALLLLGLFAPPAASADVPHVFGGDFGAATSSPANPYPLSNPTDVAVDNSGGMSTGDIYVTDPANHRIEKFDSTGHFLLMFGDSVNAGTGDPDVCTDAGPPTDVCQPGVAGGGPGQLVTPRWLAIDESGGASNGDVYVADSAEARVQRFLPSGHLDTSWAEAGQLRGKTPGNPFPSALRGIAVDTTGTLYVLNAESALYKFDAHGAYTTEEFEISGAVSEKAGIAFDAANRLYVVGPSGSGFVKRYDDEGSFLGEFQPAEGATGVAAGPVGPTSGDVFVVYNGGLRLHHLRASCESQCVPIETLGSGDLTGGEGAAVDGQANTIYVADPAAGGVAVFPASIRKPTITGFYASNVTATSADLHASINPGGAATEYRFEYGPTSEYGSETPMVAVGSAQSDQQVEFHLTGLGSSHDYHFKVLAENEKGTAETYDQTLAFYPPTCPNDAVRQEVGAAHVPDCRAYELVSAQNAGTALIFPAGAPSSGEATNPARLAYVGWGGVIPEAGGLPQNLASDLYVATRSNAGWSSKFIGLPSNETQAVGGPPWTVQSSFPPGVVGEPMSTPDMWQKGVLANPAMSRIVQWNDGAYTINGCCFGVGEGEFSSNAPYLWDPDTGTSSGRLPTNLAEVGGGEEFKGQTAASADLTHFVFSSNVPFVPGGLPGDVYDNDVKTGTVKIASLTPGGGHLSAQPLAVSENGERILMTTGPGKCPGSLYVAPSCGPGELYMRVDGEHTFELAPGRNVEYVGMSGDGSRVFFTSSQKLTSEDTDSSTDLYMWVAEKAESFEPALVLVSRGEGPTGPGNENGCKATWIAGCGALPVDLVDAKTGGPPLLPGGLGGNGRSDSFIASKTGEIYFRSPEILEAGKGIPNDENLYVYREGHPQFVAALPPGDHCIAPGNIGGSVCSNGAIDRMEVTPDGSHMAFITASQLTDYQNEGFAEMYLYEPATGRMICASCVPSGESPAHDVYGSQNGLFLTDDGRVFFSTEQKLVPRDTNGGEDVYEFVGGRPQLITTGIGAGYHKVILGVIGIQTRPGLVGVSANGTDAYFASFDHLVESDLNGEELKIYDARSGGGLPFDRQPPGCAAADECHGEGSVPMQAPVDGTGVGLGSGGNHRAAVKKRRHAKRLRVRRHRHRHHGRGNRHMGMGRRHG